MNFHDASIDLKSLETGLRSRRETICETALQTGKTKCEEWDITIEKRVRRKKRMPGEEAHDSGLTNSEELARIMKSTIDKLINELHDRSIRLSSLNERFGFLLDPVNLINSDVNYLQEKVRVFSTFYKDDVNQSDLTR